MGSKSQDYALVDPNPSTRHPRSPADDSSNSTLVPRRFSNGGFESDQDKSGSQLTLYKKTKTSESDYRKDREEWTDTAITVLLDAYTEKFNQLNRSNLRGRDWEEVADAVSGRCGGGGSCEEKHRLYKSVEQCKNKVDNMKKRYKVEVQKMNSTGVGSCHWHWFKQIEVIMGNSTSNSGTNRAVDSEEKSGASSLPTQSKRLMSNNAVVANTVKSKTLPNLKWRRLVLKISGTALGGNCESIDGKVPMQIATQVAAACCLGVEVALVVGGRNFFCGDLWVSETGLGRPTAYQLGMMATVMNSILLQSALEKVGVQVRVQSAFSLSGIAEPYNKRRAIRHLEKGRVVIFGGTCASTGNPLFTTDTSAALRASEINADVVLKATNVDGVYNCHNDDSSVILEHISFRDVAAHVIPMDMMAIQYCEENRIPVVIFNLLEHGNVTKALCGEQVGTLIDQTGGMSRLT